MNTTTAIVKDSYTRAADSDIIGRFYELFLVSHPEISQMFAKTEFPMQKQLLEHGVHMAIMFCERDRHGAKEMARIRNSHSIAKMGVPPWLYSYWKSSFIQAVAETDPEFTQDIGEAWETVLQKAINHMVEGFEV